MSVDEHLAGEEKTRAEPDIGRRDFVKQSGKALYIAPTLALLGSTAASADIGGSPPPPPNGAPQPPAPGR